MEEAKRQKTPEEIRIAARERKRQQRERDSAARDQLRLSAMDDPAEARVDEIMVRIAAEDKTKYKPGIPLPTEDPEVIKTRNDKFDAEKARCERKAMEEGKRTLFALTHNLPVGWATLYPERFPKDLSNAG